MRWTAYHVFLFIIGFFVVSSLIIGMTVSLYVDSPAARTNLPSPPTAAPLPTTYLTNPPTSTIPVTTTTTTQAPPSTTVQTTTPVPLVQITCPANVSLILGTSLSLTYTGGSAVATGGCSVPPVQYADIVYSTTLTKKRSPSFSSNNLQVVADLSFGTDGATFGDSFATSAASDAYVLSARHTSVNKSVIFTLTDKTLATTFASNVTFAQGNFPQMLWDVQAQKWIITLINNATLHVLQVDTTYLLSAGVNGTLQSKNYTLLGNLQGYKFGLWKRAYLISYLPNRMCVINRNWTAGGGIVCGTGLNGDYWVPIHAETGDVNNIPAATESSNSTTVGAVFFRAIDDEFFENQTITPLTDQIEVEHWYNVNFTTGTYNAYRYKINVNDFILNSSTCIQTPSVGCFNTTSRALTRGSYQYIAHLQQESLVFALTTNNSNVLWFELRWMKPNPSTAPLWVLSQQGNLTNGIFPGVAVDGYGTIALSFIKSSNVVFPSLYATSRLNNDPPNEMRTPLLMFAGDIGSTISYSDWAETRVSTFENRTFFVSGQVSSNAEAWRAKLIKVRVQAETIERVWFAVDYCYTNNATCSQFIFTQ